MTRGRGFGGGKKVLESQEGSLRNKNPTQIRSFPCERPQGGNDEGQYQQ